MDRKRLLKTALGLLLAFTMTFAPLLSSYSVIAFAAGTDQETAASNGDTAGQGSDDPAMAGGAPAEETAPADPAKGSGDTNADTPSREDPASDPASGGDQGEAETEDDPSEDEVVDNDLFISVEPLKDDDGVVLDKAETGEKLTAEFYAFNDNPNSTAIARIRLFAEQTTVDTDNTVVEHDKEDVELKSEVGGRATTIIGKWNTLESDDPDNDKDYDIDYLEFELPAGASVSYDLVLSTATGHDDEIKANVYPKYMIADKNGNYPDTWSEPENKEESSAKFTWTGEFKWKEFEKHASVDKLHPSGTNGSYYEFREKSLDYSFSAINEKQGNTGVIYADTVELEDILYLPRTMVPKLNGLNTSGNKIVDAYGESLIEVKVEGYEYEEDVQGLKGKEFTINNLKINQPTSYDNWFTISYKITIKNPDPENADYNPVDLIRMTINPNKFQIIDSTGIKDSELVNTADVTITSVDYTKGTDETKFVFKDSADVKVTFDIYNSLYMYKGIFRIEDKDGKNQGTGASVKKNDKIYYYITLNKSGKWSIDNLQDHLPPGLIYNNDARLYTDYNVNDFIDPEKGVPLKTSIEKSSSGATTVSFDKFISDSPSTAYIAYSATVSEKEFKPGVVLENTATLGSLYSKISVRTSNIKKVTLKKAVVARYSKNIKGKPFVVFGDYNPTSGKYDSIELMGDLQNVNAKNLNSNSMTYDEKYRALHEFNAGDTIVYNLYAINEGDADFEGIITDYSPFNDTYQSNTSGYKYQVAGNNTYYEVDAERSHGTSTRSGDLGQAVYGVISSYVSYYSGSAKYYVRHTDFTENASNLSVNISYGSRSNATWSFSRSAGKTLKAGKTSIQSVIVQIPGAQNTAMDLTDASTRAYEEMVTSYAYHSNYGSNPGWQNRAFINGDGVYGTYTDYIYHSMADQTFIHTGTVATREVEDINNIKDGEIWTAYDGPSALKDSSTNDMKIYRNSKNHVIVNYVYIYNDGDDEMSLSSDRYSVKLNIPPGFKYLGLLDEQGTHNGSDGRGIAFNKVGSSAAVNSFKMQWLIARSIRNGERLNTAGGNDVTYGVPEQLYGVSNSHSDKNYGSKANIYTASTGSSTNGTTVYLNTSDIKIPAYTGVMFYYACAVSDTEEAGKYSEDNKASFVAELSSGTGRYVNRMSPALILNELYTVWSTSRVGFDNIGINSSVEKPSRQSWLDGDLHGSAVSESNMKAGVQLYPVKEDQYKVSVSKQAL